MYKFNDLFRNTIPNGTYKVIIDDVKFQTSKTTGVTNNLSVYYRVLEGPYAKRIIIDTLYEKAFSFRLRPFLVACGIDINREFTTVKEMFDYGILNAKGKTILVEVETNKYNGNEYNQIKSWAALASSTTSTEDVLDLLGVNPEVQPDKPNLTDLGVADNTVVDTVPEPQIDFDLGDTSEIF